jgi:chromate transporter
MKEIAALFLKLGATAFGGPAAHIALMEEECVRKRAWLTRAEFLDLLGMAQLIPGPNSTELAIHIGHRRAGWPGLIVAGVSFILPAFAFVAALAWAYTRWGYLPQADAFLWGLRPALVAIIGQVVWTLGEALLIEARLRIAALTCLAAALFAGVPELVVLLGAGAVLAAARVYGSRSKLNAVEPVSLSLIFLFFLKIGAVLFGSGYVLLSFLRGDLVQRFGWLSERQLLDAFAVGQMTPGPVFTTATFIGFLLQGWQGAVLATLGIFLPSFIFVALSAPLLPKLRGRPATAAFLDGVNVASLALIAAVLLRLGWGLRADPWSLVLAALALAALLGPLKQRSTWVLLVCGLLGVLKQALQSGMT